MQRNVPHWRKSRFSLSSSHSLTRAHNSLLKRLNVIYFVLKTSHTFFFFFRVQLSYIHRKVELRLFDVCFTLIFMQQMLSPSINFKADCWQRTRMYVFVFVLVCVSVQVLCRFQLLWHMHLKRSMHTLYARYKIPLTLSKGSYDNMQPWDSCAHTHTDQHRRHAQPRDKK